MLQALRGGGWSSPGGTGVDRVAVAVTGTADRLATPTEAATGAAAVAAVAACAVT